MQARRGAPFSRLVASLVLLLGSIVVTADIAGADVRASYHQGEIVPSGDTKGLLIADVVGDDSADLVINEWRGPSSVEGLLTTTQNEDNGLLVFEGHGDGTFSDDPLWLPVGDFLWDIVAADLNLDGRLDLAVTASPGTKVVIFLKNETGGFDRSPVEPTIPHESVGDLVPYDIDNDGDVDLVLQTSRSAYVLRNAGKAVFTTEHVAIDTSGAVKSVFPPGMGALAVSDFNGDAIGDIAVSSQSRIKIVYGLPGAVYPTEADEVLDLGGGTGYLFAPDFDADGYSDLVAVGLDASGSTDSWRVLSLRSLGNRGGFELVGEPIEVAASSLWDVALGDLDGDGDEDIVTTGVQGHDPVSILLADGTGSFIRPEVSRVPTNGSLYLAVGDVNGDRSADVVVAPQGAVLPFLAIPRLAVDLWEVDFGAVALGTTSQSPTITISNDGLAPLHAAVSIAGDDRNDFRLTIDTCTGTPVGPGSSCDVQIVFDPTATGARSAVLEITDGEPRPYSFPLSGCGTRHLNARGLCRQTMTE